MSDLERLAAYDRMYADLLKERDKVLSDMEKLRAAGKNKGATYQQLLAQKLTLQHLIGRVEIYGNKCKISHRIFRWDIFLKQGTFGPQQACSK